MKPFGKKQSILLILTMAVFLLAGSGICASAEEMKSLEMPVLAAVPEQSAESENTGEQKEQTEETELTAEEQERLIREEREREKQKE